MCKTGARLDEDFDDIVDDIETRKLLSIYELVKVRYLHELIVDV